LRENLWLDWIEKMLDWIGDTFLAIVTAVPALFVDQDSPRFFLIRGMLGYISCLGRMPHGDAAISPFPCALHGSNLFARKA
jgi:hypothetical protein